MRRKRREYSVAERQVRRGRAALDQRERRLLAQRIGCATARKILAQLRSLQAPGPWAFAVDVMPPV